MLTYFIIGLVVGFLLELAMSVTTGDRVNWGERIVIITLWPLMGILFIVNFIRGFFLMSVGEGIAIFFIVLLARTFVSFLMEIWEDKYQRKRKW